jgi:hypothetical protein
VAVVPHPAGEGQNDDRAEQDGDKQKGGNFLARAGLTHELEIG